MTEDRLINDELIIYRVYISPETLPLNLFSDGVRNFEVTEGLPKGVFWLRSGWEYHNGCMYLDFVNKKPGGKPLPPVYVMMIVQPVYRELSKDEIASFARHE